MLRIKKAKNVLAEFPGLILDVTLEQAELFADILTSLFAEMGTGVDSEPNSIGFEIEDIIDLFNQG